MTDVVANRTPSDGVAGIPQARGAGALVRWFDLWHNWVMGDPTDRAAGGCGRRVMIPGPFLAALWGN
jgi:hypothetical protein